MRVYHGVLLFCEEIIRRLNPLMGHRTLCCEETIRRLELSAASTTSVTVVVVE
jgi:hypothetical protein